jgi:hemolysin activation/secretion protein
MTDKVFSKFFLQTESNTLHKIILLLFVLISYGFGFSAFAQENDIKIQDRIIRQQQDDDKAIKRQREFNRIEKERENIVKEIKENDLSWLKESDDCFTIKKMNISGAELLSEDQIKKIELPFLGKCFTRDVSVKISDQINLIYHNLGYITIQVTFPPQNIIDGDIRIEVLEGRVEQIILNKDKFTDEMQKFSAFGFMKNKNLNINDINQGISQMNQLPSNDAKMKVEPGEKVGYSKVIIDNKSKFPARARIGYDNLGNEFTGIRKTNFSGTLDNLLFLNDQINLTYNANLDDPSNEKDLRSFTSSISIPFSYNNFSYNYSRTTYRGQDYGSSGAVIVSGYSNSNNVAIDRVLLNNSEYRISAKVSLSTKETASYINKNKTAGSERRLTIGGASLTISKYFKNGASLYLRPEYSEGLKLFDANKDDAGLTTDMPKAQFHLYKLYGQISKRFQVPKIKIPISLSIEMDSQMSSDTLFGSEQFSVGGYNSVRGFREDYIAGDHGYYFRNKASFNLGQLIVPSLLKKDQADSKNNFMIKSLNYLYKINMEPFYDYGYVKTKYNGDSGRLSGTGLKATFFGKYLDASLTYSWGLSRSNLITSSDKENKMLYFTLSAKCC